MRLLAIDEMLFRQAFDRDVTFHDDCPQSAILDRESGEIFWVYANDDDAHTEAGISPEVNAAIRQRVADGHDRYLEIPGHDHGEHHEILQEFLASDWTEDEEAKSTARAAYFGSIGGWKKVVDDKSVVDAFVDFRERRTKQMAEAFLRAQGIEPQWR
jgi:hypothetical protein